MQNKKLFRFRYDKAYKWLITYFLKDAIEFLHPNLYVLIDWNKEFTFQEQELANLSNNNKLYIKVDKLIEFTLLDNKRVFILLHIEIQQSNPTEIAKRMFNYYTHLILKYPDKEVHSLLVYIGKEQHNNMHIFSVQNESISVEFKFTYFNLAEQSKEFLLSKNNLLGICLFFTKMIQEKNNKEASNYTLIRETIELIKKINKSVDEYKKFINFVEEIIPINVEPELDKYINQEKNNIMGNLSHINSMKKANAVVESVETLWKEGKTLKDYITQGIKIGIQEGIQEGIQKGKQEGIKEGRQEGILTGMEKGMKTSILNLHKKGYKAPQIADLLDFELAFVEKIIEKNNG